MARKASIREALPGLGRTLRFVWPFARPHRPLIAGSFGALFATVVFRTLEPWPLKFVFDEIIVGGVAPSGSAALQLGAAGLALVLIIGGRALFTYYQQVGFALIGNKVMTEVRGALYRHMQRLPLSYHNRTRKGDLVVRVIGDIGLLREVSVTALMPLVGSVMILLLMMGLMFWLNWKLALVIALVLPVFALPTGSLGRKIQTASRDQRKREGAMASTAAETMSAIHVVQTLSLEERFSSTFGGQNRKSLKEGVKQRRLSARLQGTVQVLIGVMTAIVVFFGSWLVLVGSLTAGELLVFLSYLKAAFRPMQDFAKYTARIAKASAAGERVLDVFEREPEIADAPHARDAGRLKGHIRFESVTFAYESGRPVLHDITLSIPAGTRMAIVGPSGNGKSTLASLVPRLYDPQRGRVTLDGVDLRDLTLSSVRGNVSMVLQDNLLFASSLRENIRFGAPDATDEQVEVAARLANCDTFIRRLPEGLETDVAERGVTLSAGQRQRIAIARAAVRSAPILILDEPTTGLDEENLREVVAALERVAEGRTVLLITHDMKLASRSDIIVYLEDGRIAEMGTHASLLSRGGRYAALFRLQSLAGGGEGNTTRIDAVRQN